MLEGLCFCDLSSPPTSLSALLASLYDQACPLIVQQTDQHRISALNGALQHRFKLGLWGGLAHAALDTYLLRGYAPWTLRHRYYSAVEVIHLINV